ncbi:hypothetical protein LEP1GSC193_2709 [Leptospira alstonii serovar Pingchang str. 80-412]|uniref:Uncharacterized protein n=2 Tax=Leptospira alstonii TaxID=28452 RepID=M6CQC0_9LEPT|nr:hypothetical protein LEP1GSC194_0151 [Leptospira alstonii serovar Sichuan str. 79601]EQA79241.1 hypothetical protein LEP1GSC193_2709 [Leptospira alstonii serovar Pingchang str. 80-412]
MIVQNGFWNKLFIRLFLRDRIEPGFFRSIIPPIPLIIPPDRKRL